MSYPSGLPDDANFRMESVNLAAPVKGEIQVRNTWMSVDPYMRGQMRGKDTYVPGFKVGQPLFGGAVGVVIASESSLFVEEDVVLSRLGWREAFNAPAKQLTKIDAAQLPQELYLGAAGLTGLTAYVGLLKVANIKKGDVLLVSGAAGAVGSVACQIAKLKGAFVIGSAGGPEKCGFLRTIGVDRVIDYKNTMNHVAAIRTAAPKGLDVYFDNVGGRHLEAAMLVAKPGARFALCGNISTYNDAHQSLPSFNSDTKQLSLKRFLVSDYFHLMHDFISEMTDWIRRGSVVARQTVDIGLDQAVGAFLKLFLERT